MKKEKKARQTARLTKKYIDVLPLVTEGKQDYWDADLRGFMLRISPKQKTYYAVKKLLGKPVWVNLGIHGQITPDGARKRAINELSEITKGINPNKKKKQAKEKGLTLKQAFEKYLEAKPDLKDSTVRTYKVMINKNLKKWLNKPLMDITDQKIEDMFLEITKVSSKANANNSMRTFKLLYNFAKRKDKTLPDNPVQVLTAGQQWHKIGRRDTYIKDHQLKAWYDAVMELGNPYIKDYLILQLLTGMREREGLTLKWSEVDLKDKSFTILETKNREPLTLPMSDAIFDLFCRLKVNKINDYVFPSLVKKDAHLVEVKKQVKDVSVMSGVSFCLHDLRRTFITIAQDEVPYLVLKKLVNHSVGSDVTAGYSNISLDKLRPHQQTITNKILKAAGLTRTAKVINLR